MNNSSKEIYSTHFHRNHPTKSDRDTARPSTSKLSKKELEDLYFALVENNISLKKTVNSQQEQIKFLSTKVLRLTSQQKQKMKDFTSKKLLNTIDDPDEQLEELKRVNSKLSNSVHMLNMKLCSAKQFLKKSPGKSRCQCCHRPPSCITSSASIYNMRTDRTINQSSECLKNIENANNSLVPNNTPNILTILPEKDAPEKICDENKYVTQMSELKQKIVDLQEELSKTHQDHGERMSRLEAELLQLQNENIRTRAERARSEECVREKENDVRLLEGRLRAVETRCSDLNLQLTLEQKKVSELEAELKSTKMSADVAKTIQKCITETPATNDDQKPPRLITEPMGNVLRQSPITNDDQKPPRLITEPMVNLLRQNPTEAVSERREVFQSRRRESCRETPEMKFLSQRHDSRINVKRQVSEDSDAPSTRAVQTRVGVSQIGHTSTHSSPVGTASLHMSKLSDDSGVMMENKAEQDLEERKLIDGELLKRINELQSHLDLLKMKALNPADRIADTDTPPYPQSPQSPPVGGELKRKPEPMCQLKPSPKSSDSELFDTWDAGVRGSAKVVEDAARLSEVLVKRNPESKAGTTTLDKVISQKTRSSFIPKDRPKGQPKKKLSIANEEVTVQTISVNTSSNSLNNATYTKEDKAENATGKVEAGTDADGYQLCQHFVKVCTCRSVPSQPPPPPLRSCGGQDRLEFHASTPGGFRVCSCAKLQEPPYSRAKACSPVSADNTDLDVSSICSTPRDKKDMTSSYKSPPLSPGERKYQDASSSPHTFATSDTLSEGEMPMCSRNLSIGERPVEIREKPGQKTAKADKGVPLSRNIENTIRDLSAEIYKINTVLQTSSPVRPSHNIS